MTFKLSRYEDQAKLSFYLGLLGLAAVAGVMFLLFRNFDLTTFYVSYDPKRSFLPVLGAGMLVGLVAAGVGFFMSLNSAGQKRNTLSRLAWQAFFLNAIVITCLLSAGLFFMFTRYQVVAKPPH
ncbi:MAG: hypothetical protein AB1716_17105 [Planctomycetota bacterium]